MRGLEELQPAELHERDVAPRELDLERPRVVRGAEQHRLLAQLHSGLAIRQDALDDELDLRSLVRDHGDDRPAAAGAPREQVLGEALRRVADHAVAGVEDRLARAVVLLERDHLRPRLEAVRQLEDVLHSRRAERVDRLRIVAHDGEPGAVGLQPEQDRSLQRVGVLVLVDEHVVEARGDAPRELLDPHHLLPVEQQVVVVEHRLGLLCLDVRAEKALQRLLPVGAPGKRPRKRLAHRHAAVDRVGIDREAGRLLRKAALRRGEAQVVAHQVHQVRGVAAIEDRESRIQADALRVQPQQLRADRVEGSRPLDRSRGNARAPGERASAQALDPPRHLQRHAPREREQQDAPGMRAVQDQVGDAVRKGLGLARAGARDHEQRRRRRRARNAEGRRGGLRRVQPVQVRRSHGARARCNRDCAHLPSLLPAINGTGGYCIAIQLR